MTLFKLTNPLALPPAVSLLSCTTIVLLASGYCFGTLTSTWFKILLAFTAALTGIAWIYRGNNQPQAQINFEDIFAAVFLVLTVMVLFVCQHGP